MALQHTISSRVLLLSDLERILLEDCQLTISSESKEKIVRCREYLDNKIANTSQPLYGINTGFGSLYNKNISKSASFGLPLICVGNLSVGGTGKSPMVEYLVSNLKDQFKVAT